MKRVLCGLLMALASHTALADEIVTPAEPFTGWSWYNEPKKPPEQPRKPQQPAPQAIPDLSKMSPMEQARVLKGYTQEALNRAILYPSRENTATFLRWQKFWTDRASMFSQSFAAAQLSHPGAGYHGSVYRDSGLCRRGENHSTEGGDICTGDPTGGRSSGDDGACSYAPGGERNERRRCPGADHQILCR